MIVRTDLMRYTVDIRLTPTLRQIQVHQLPNLSRLRLALDISVVLVNVCLSASSVTEFLNALMELTKIH